MKRRPKLTRVITIRGLPPDLQKGMESLARRTSSTKSGVYSDAIKMMSRSLMDGEVVLAFPASFPGSRLCVKLPREIVDEADIAIERSSVPLKKSQFVREACWRYLGDDAPECVMEVPLSTVSPSATQQPPPRPPGAAS